MSNVGANKKDVKCTHKEVIGSPINRTTLEEVIVPDQLKVTKHNQHLLIIDKVLDTDICKKFIGFASLFGLQRICCSCLLRDI